MKFWRVDSKSPLDITIPRDVHVGIRTTDLYSLISFSSSLRKNRYPLAAECPGLVFIKETEEDATVSGAFKVSADLTRQASLEDIERRRLRFIPTPRPYRISESRRFAATFGYYIANKKVCPS